MLRYAPALHSVPSLKALLQEIAYLQQVQTCQACSTCTTSNTETYSPLAVDTDEQTRGNMRGNDWPPWAHVQMEIAHLVTFWYKRCQHHQSMQGNPLTMQHIRQGRAKDGLRVAESQGCKMIKIRRQILEGNRAFHPTKEKICQTLTMHLAMKQTVLPLTPPALAARSPDCQMAWQHPQAMPKTELDDKPLALDPPVAPCTSSSG